MLWICEDCTTAYSVGALSCPNCGSLRHHDQGDEPGPTRPAKSATKAEWMAYAETFGIEVHGDHITKDELIVAVEAVEAGSAVVDDGAVVGPAESEG
jgi:hypothetical protein